MSQAAISTGSGKSMIKPALAAGAQVLIAGDFDHHNMLDALDAGLALIDAGHFGTEHFVAELLGNELERLGLEIRVAQEESPFTDL